MNTRTSLLIGARLDVSTLEADMAFFEARLSLAAEDSDTLYQRAQIKAYQTLGVLLGDTLKRVQPKRRKAGSGRKTKQTAE